jgi:hypothetical protein
MYRWQADGTQSVPATLVEGSAMTIAEFYRFARRPANAVCFDSFRLSWV